MRIALVSRLTRVLKGLRSYPDKVRGVLNEGGLYGEREGWHLPGFDTSAADWTTRDLAEGLPDATAGVGFFVTTFELAYPAGSDVLTSFEFAEEFGQPYRALLFVNGWMFGKVCWPVRAAGGRGEDAHSAGSYSASGIWAPRRSSLSRLGF